MPPSADKPPPSTCGGYTAYAGSTDESKNSEMAVPYHNILSVNFLDEKPKGF
jgi:hypothetical protein